MESGKISPLVFNSTFLDLGEHSVTPVKFTFYAKNVTEQPAELEILPACGCTVVDYPKNVPPGQEVEITGKFNRSSKTTYTKTIRVLINPYLTKKFDTHVKVGEFEETLTIRVKLV